MSKSNAIAVIAALALAASGPAQAQTRSSMALPASAQAAAPGNCLVRPDVPGDKNRDRNGDGILDDCGATRNAPTETATRAIAAAAGSGFPTGILLAVLAVVGAAGAAAGGGGGGGNDSPG